jgi:hypothetical protein
MFISETTSEIRPEVQDLLSQGLALSQIDDGLGAAAAFAAATQLAPAYALPYFLLACERAAMGEVDQAEAAFAQTLLLDNQFHLARFQLGLLQFSSGRPAIAALTWQGLLALSDDNPLPDFVRGFAFLAQELFRDALQEFEAGMVKNQNNAPLNEDIARVVAQIKTALPPPADDQHAHFLLANYQQQGQYPQ